MENSNKIIPPHLNAEVYRTDFTGTNTVSYLDYIRIQEDGKVLIGCSELTGRYWNGGGSIYGTVTDAQKINTESKRNISLTSATADGCFIENSNKVLLCEDSGGVSIWANNDEDNQNAWQQWGEEISVAEHDDAALAVDCLDPGKEYVTVGGDGNAKVWDINEMICVRNYRAAHSLAIYGVAVRPASTANFATGSMDQYVTFWDENIDKPVLDLAVNDCGIRCLQWVDSDQLLFGDEAGVLRLVDIRNPDYNSVLMEFPAAVHKLSLHPDCDKVAVCCDNKTVSVCELDGTNKAKVVYQNRNAHNNYARGAAWDPQDKDILHTVGWDGELKSHSLRITVP